MLAKPGLPANEQSVCGQIAVKRRLQFPLCHLVALAPSHWDSWLRFQERAIHLFGKWEDEEGSREALPSAA